MDMIQTNKLDNRGNIVTSNQFPDVFLYGNRFHLEFP